jgi:hypothetical protein
MRKKWVLDVWWWWPSLCDDDKLSNVVSGAVAILCKHVYESHIFNLSNCSWTCDDSIWKQDQSGEKMDFVRLNKQVTHQKLKFSFYPWVLRWSRPCLWSSGEFSFFPSVSNKMYQWVSVCLPNVCSTLTAFGAKQDAWHSSCCICTSAACKSPSPFIPLLSVQIKMNNDNENFLSKLI